MNRNYNFDVQTVQSGQPRKHADSIYSYLIQDNSTQPHPESIVKKFCTVMLRQGFERDKMPNPFAGEIIEFTKINERYYRYIVKELSTD